MNKERLELTQEIVQEFFTYEPLTGALFFNKRDAKWFKNGDKQDSEWNAKAWNSKKAGTRADHKRHDGYRRVGIGYHRYLAHRIIWLYMTGEWPDDVDHQNGDPSDNRWENLRNVTRSLNMKNAKRRKDNTSGQPGVCWITRDKLWWAYVHEDGKMISLLKTEDKEAAIKARLEYEPLYEYHPNSGRETISNES